MSKKEKKKVNDWQTEVHLDIPEDEIWTYQVPGLAAPHIGKPFKNAKAKRILLALVILVAVSLSMYFSVRTVQSDTFEYTSVTQGIEFTRFSNTGYIKEVTIDYVTDIVYDQENSDVYTNFSFTKDETQPITSVREYAFNCDGVVEVINHPAQHLLRTSAEQSVGLDMVFMGLDLSVVPAATGGISILIPLMAGFGVTVLSLSRVVKFFLDKHPVAFTRVILGFVLASTILITPVAYASVTQLLIGLGCFAGGFAVSYIMDSKKAD